MRSAWIILERSLSLLVMLCSLAIAGCAPSRSTPAPKLTSQPTRVSSPPWESISLPASGVQLLSYTVSPTDPETVYACIGNHEGSIALWHTRDTGRHWASFPFPGVTGTGCTLSIASSQPQRIAVEVTNAYDDQRPCDRDVLYLSIDSGGTWQRIPHASIAPRGASNGFCTITVTSHYLYLWYTYGGGLHSPQVSLLERTGDNGTTWSRADTDFGAGVFFFPPQLGKDDTLATIVRHSSPASETGAVLWMSDDAGRSWQQMGTLPASVGTFLLTPRQQDLSWPTPAAPFYALAHEQLPSNLYDLQVLQSTDGRQWFTIPPLPVPGASTKHPGLLQTLAVTNDGHLLAFGVDPKIGVPVSIAAEQRPIATFWLWVWDPRASHW